MRREKIGSLAWGLSMGNKRALGMLMREGSKDLNYEYEHEYEHEYDYR